MKKLLKSFVYAGKGIAYCLRHERNMRIHFVFMAYLYGYLLIYDFFEISRTQFAVLLLTCALVVFGECVNTAIEKCIDAVVDGYNKMAGISKDAAAGAVLVAAIFSVLVGVVIMWQPEAFRQLFLYYKEKPYMLIVLTLSLILSVLFIFKGDKTGVKKDND